MTISDVKSGVRDDVQRRAARWRKLAIPAGLLLAATCFLPAVPSCNSDIVPARELASAARGYISPPVTLNGTLELLGCICGFLSAYLAGLLLALAAMARLRGWHDWNRLLGQCLLGLLLLTAVTTMVGFIWESFRSGAPSVGDWLIWLACCVGPGVVLLYLLITWRWSKGRMLSQAFILCLWMLCWFGGWFVLDSVRYGLRLSFAASGLLLVATIGEARAVTGQSWLRTIGQLLTGRLARPLESRGHCPKCDYLLCGLSEMRCPECGRPFTLEELGVPGEQMGFQAASEPLVGRDSRGE